MAQNNPSNLDYSSLGSTDNVIVRSHGADGRAVQSSAITIDDFGMMTGFKALNFGTPFPTGFTGAGVTMYQFGIQTTDATESTLASLTTANGESLFIKAFVQATRSDHTETVGGELIYLARNVGSGAVQIGDPIVNVISDSSGQATFTASVSGNDVRVRVVGEAAKTFNWVTFITTYKVLTNS